MAIIQVTEVLGIVWTLLIMLSGTTEYPECNHQSESTLDCCIVSQGMLRCEQAVCPDGYYKASSTSTCNSSENSAEDNMGTTMPAAPTNVSTQIPSEETTAGLQMFEISSPRGETTSKKTSSAVRTTLLDYLSASTSVTAATSKNSSLQVYCCQCHPTCLTCSGKGPEDCLSCAGGYEWVSTNTTEGCIISGNRSFDKQKVLILAILFPSVILLSSVFLVYMVRKRLKANGRNTPGSGSSTDSMLTSKTSGTNHSELYSINREPEDDAVFFVQEPKSFRQQNIYLPTPNVPSQRVSQTESTWVGRLCNLGPTAPIFLQLEGIPPTESVRRSAEISYESFLKCEDVYSQSMPQEPVYTEIRDTDEHTNADVHCQSMAQEPVYTEIRDTDEHTIADVHTARSCFTCSRAETKSYCTTPALNRTLRSSGYFEIVNISDNSDLGSVWSETSGYTSAWISPDYPPDNVSSCFSLSVKSTSDYYAISPASISDFSEEELLRKFSLATRQSRTSFETFSISDDSLLFFPIISPCWEFSAEFSTNGGVLRAQNSTVCLEVTQGAVEAEHVVTIHGALSADFNKVYDTLPLPEDEVIVTPVAEYFAGSSSEYELYCLTSCRPNRLTI